MRKKSIVLYLILRGFFLASFPVPETIALDVISMDNNDSAVLTSQHDLSVRQNDSSTDHSLDQDQPINYACAHCCGQTVGYIIGSGTKTNFGGSVGFPQLITATVGTGLGVAFMIVGSALPINPGLYIAGSVAFGLTTVPYAVAWTSYGCGKWLNKKTFLNQVEHARNDYPGTCCSTTSLNNFFCQSDVGCNEFSTGCTKFIDWITTPFCGLSFKEETILEEIEEI